MSSKNPFPYVGDDEGTNITDPDDGEPKARSVSNAPGRQVGGTHYAGTYQHWDFVEENGLGYMEGQITRYVGRWRNKDGVEALHKAVHYVEKLIEMFEWGRRNENGALCTGLNMLAEQMNLTFPEKEIFYLVFRWRTRNDLRLIIEKIKALEGPVT